MNSTWLLLPDVNARPLYDAFNPSDVFVITAPTIVQLAAAWLALKQSRSPFIDTIRFSLLPLGLYLYFQAVTFRDFSGGDPKFNVLNYGQGVGSFTGAMKLIQSTFMRTKPKKLLKPVVVRPGEPKPEWASLPRRPAKANLTDLFSYLADPRGLRWNVDQRAYRASDPRNTENRGTFLLQTAWRAALDICALDLTQTILQTVPTTLTTAGSPTGGSIYADHLPILQRYLLSSALCLGSGLAVYLFVETGHHLFTLFCVGLLRTDPADHPPIFDKPWMATSVRDFWSKRWHSMFRGDFNAIGWPVGSALFGDVGGVLGVFFLSGLLHSITIWGVGKGIDFWRINGFFLLQGVGILIEIAWGRKIGGFWGRLWAFAWILVTAHLVIEAWLSRGFGGAQFFLPDDYRPFLRIRDIIMSTSD